MHELSLAEGVVHLIEAQAAEARFNRVCGVRLAIGALSCVDAEALRFSFDAVARNTIADAATLTIARIPGEGWCATCGHSVRIETRLDPCPDCGAVGLRVTGGADMLLESLEVI